MGLIYGIGVYEDNDVLIKMTLTTPGRPMHDNIINGVKYRVSLVEEVGEMITDLVREPAWNHGKMSDKIKEMLGFG